MNVRVGDIIKLENNQFVAVSLIILPIYIQSNRLTLEWQI